MHQALQTQIDLVEAYQEITKGKKVVAIVTLPIALKKAKKVYKLVEVQK